MQKQFWKAKGLSGFANTDLVSERFWALGPESPEERGLLLSYVIGERAAKLDAMDVQSRVQRTLADAESVFPGRGSSSKRFEQRAGARIRGSAEVLRRLVPVSLAGFQ
jgi:monoamine oxidase